MDTNYFIKENAIVEPHRAVEVFERNADGLLVGKYKGFYNPSRYVFTLYPCYSPHVWNVKNNVKHEVNEHLVRRER